MTNDEALKINGLYAQIDQLTVENNTLKSTGTQHRDDLVTKLDLIESKLDKLLVDKGKTK